MDPVISDHWVAWVRADAGAEFRPGLARRAGARYRAGARAGRISVVSTSDTDYKNGSFPMTFRQEGLLLDSDPLVCFARTFQRTACCSFFTTQLFAQSGETR